MSEEDTEGGEGLRKEITFPAKLAKSGNGAHIMVSRRYLEMLGAGIGDDVDVTIRIPEQRQERNE